MYPRLQRLVRSFFFLSCHWRARDVAGVECCFLDDVAVIEDIKEGEKVRDVASEVHSLPTSGSVFGLPKFPAFTFHFWVNLVWEPRGDKVNPVFNTPAFSTRLKSLFRSLFFLLLLVNIERGYQTIKRQERKKTRATKQREASI